MSREFNGKKYYGLADVAKIIGVDKTTVWHWQTTLYFDCPLFTADERAHDGRYLYEVERVMQLKAVYHPNWTRGGYEPSPTTSNVPNEPSPTTTNEVQTPAKTLPKGKKFSTATIDRINLLKQTNWKLMALLSLRGFLVISVRFAALATVLTVLAWSTTRKSTLTLLLPVSVAGILLTS